MKETLFGQIEIAGMSPRFGILNLDGGRTTLTLQGDNIAHAFPFVAGESCHIKGMFENDTRQFHMLGALIPNTTGDTLTLRPSVGLESSLPPDEAASLFTSLFRTADSGIAEIEFGDAGLTRLLAPREQATASTTSHPTAWGPARLIAPDDRTDLSPSILAFKFDRPATLADAWMKAAAVAHLCAFLTGRPHTPNGWNFTEVGGSRLKVHAFAPGIPPATGRPAAFHKGMMSEHAFLELLAAWVSTHAGRPCWRRDLLHHHLDADAAGILDGRTRLVAVCTAFEDRAGTLNENLEAAALKVADALPTALDGDFAHNLKCLTRAAASARDHIVLVHGGDRGTFPADGIQDERAYLAMSMALEFILVLSELEACGLGCEHWADPDPGLPISHWPARIMRMAPAIHTQAGAINAGFYKILKDIR